MYFLKHTSYDKHYFILIQRIQFGIYAENGFNISRVNIKLMFREGQYHVAQFDYYRNLHRHSAGYFFTFLYTYMIFFSVQLFSNARLITSPGIFTPHWKCT